MAFQAATGPFGLANQAWPDDRLPATVCRTQTTNTWSPPPVSNRSPPAYKAGALPDELGGQDTAGIGAENRNRTGGLLITGQSLYHLSYFGETGIRPVGVVLSVLERAELWCGMQDSNLRSPEATGLQPVGLSHSPNSARPDGPISGPALAGRTARVVGNSARSYPVQYGGPGRIRTGDNLHAGQVFSR